MSLSIASEGAVPELAADLEIYSSALCSSPTFEANGDLPTRGALLLRVVALVVHGFGGR